MKKKRVLTYQNGKSHKFWEIHLSGSEHSVRYGRVGTDGQERTKTFDSEEKARNSCEKLIQQKLDKGYVESRAKPAKKKPVTAKTKRVTGKKAAKATAAKAKTTAKGKTAKRTAKKKVAGSKVVKSTTKKVKKKPVAGKSKAAEQQLLRIETSIRLFGPDRKPTSNPDHLQLLDGYISPESLLEYLGTWDGPQLSGGHIICDYDPKTKRLLLRTEYNSDTKLTRKQVTWLKDDTCGQWSDGMGEGCFDEFMDLTLFGFEAYSGTGKIKTTQTTGAAASASGRPKLKALRKRWKAVMTKSMAEGGKKELKALLKAIDAGDESAVRKLMGTVDLNQGMRFTEIQFDESTPLYLAVWNNDPKLVKLLLDAGADPHAASHYDTAPIHRCSGVATLKLLLAAGADPNSMSTERLTPLLQRRIMQDPKLVKVLLKNGADPNKKGHTSPLLFCVGRAPCLASAKALIEAGAETSEETFIAAASFYPNRAQLQDDETKKKADKLARFLFDEIDVTEQSLKALQYASLKMARLILTADVDLNQLIDDYGRPKYALQFAILNGKHGTKIIKLLLEAGADPNLCPDVLSSVIRYEWDHATAKMLLKHGAIPSEDDINVAEESAPKLVKSLRAAMT